jgi:hypothetical protein
VTQIVDEERWGKLGWYVKKALLYQHERALIAETDEYNNSSLTETEIEAERIVRYASASEDAEGNVVLKVAKGTAGNLEPLTYAEKNGLQAYFNIIRPAGVRVVIITADADLLKVVIDVQYDALILDSEGKRLDGSNDTPVLEAINNYLSNIEFAGEFTNMAFENSIEAVEGCKIVDLRASFSKYSGFDYVPISYRYRSYAGYMEIDEVNSQINYLPYD